MAARNERVLLIGLDCAEPSLVFEAFRSDLPNLQRLARNGLWGRLESCHPPDAVPGWSCLMSGRDPGELGIYGMRNRVRRTYDPPALATSLDVAEKRIWQILAAEGRRCAVVGVPGTDPPSPVNGLMVSSFLASSNGAPHTHPAELAGEIDRIAGGALVDAGEPRTEDKRRLASDLRTATGKRFRVARHLLARESWDFFALVEMGIDRIHHAFWRFYDREHRRYEPGSPYHSAIHDHYVALDAEIGRLVDAAGDMSVLVVSSHGAQAMEGGVRINQWLLEEGYLHLRDEPDGAEDLDLSSVDWPRTQAWADGGPHGRVFINLAGREPRGGVPPSRLDSLRDEIAGKLEALEDHCGRPMGNRVLRPEAIYRSVRNIAPDLLVEFGDLAWRAVDTVGGEGVLAFEDHAGLADSNHARQGILIYHGPDVPAAARGREMAGLSIYDVAPTLLEKFRIPAGAGLRGRSFLGGR
jgi:predicted AlkP superfamily phosphohydrolase/phosphomutase